MALSRGITATLVCLLLGVFLVQAAGPLWLLGATCDETTHLPSGYTYLKTRSFRLNPQHPPLVKELCALPLLVLDPQLNLDDPSWSRNPPDEWTFGRNFLAANDAARLLFWGRVPVVVLGLLLGLYTFLWARSLFGDRGGLLALLLYALCPNVIAHSRLVTMDVGLSLFFVASLYHLHRYVRGGGTGHLAGSGLALGLALASKFSAVILLPIVALLLGFAALTPARAALPPFDDPDLRTRLGRAGLGLLLVFGLGLLVVYAVYLFPPDTAVYWKGIREVNKDHAQGYAFYLAGEFKPGGWLHYFLAAFLLKTPLPTLLLLLSSVVLYRTAPLPDRTGIVWLALPAAAFFAFTSLFADNLGVRYILPVYPLVMIFAGRLGAALPARRSHRMAHAGLLGLLALWLVIDAARIYPDHLAYFNALAGGPSQGHRWLDDSNIDWGSDLGRLKRYMDERGIDRIRLLYDWTDRPEAYGIAYEAMNRSDWEGSPSPGVYAISTQMLIRGKYFERARGLRTDWLARYRPIDRIGYGFYIFRF